MSRDSEPLRKPARTRRTRVVETDVRRLKLLPYDLPEPIVDAFTEAEKRAALAFCLPR